MNLRSEAFGNYDGTDYHETKRFLIFFDCIVDQHSEKKVIEVRYSVVADIILKL